MGGGGGGSGGPRSTDPNATASGVYISGGWLFNALDGDNLDAYEQEARTLDVCVSHASPFGDYHYHAWSPCIKSSWTAFSATDAPALCRDSDVCMNDLTTAITDVGYFSKANNGGVIGVAKDGHLLVGPWNDNGDLWSCEEHDICNGRVDSNGNYVYVATGTFPYHVGCWGPAAQQSYPTDCSETHSCGLGSDNGGSNPYFSKEGKGKRGKSEAQAYAVSLLAMFSSL